MAIPRRKVWDQEPGEEPEDYADFLFYRNLGPRRSLRMAYRRYIRQNVKSESPNAKPPDYSHLEASPRWKRLARERNWKSRAIAWDISALKNDGGTILALQSRTLKRLAYKACRAAKGIQIEDSRDLLEILKTIQSYLTPELAAAHMRSGEVAEEPKELAAVSDGVE